ncbi:MAG: MFS transporter [Planctomycetes bacterium]|nr:MFS transporter [Planctomycetota bacterium]
MGRDRGAALVLEQAMLPSTATDRTRTAAFARYHLAQDAGHAIGSGAAALPVLLRALGCDEVAALQLSIVVASVLLGSSAVVYAGLSRAIEAAPGGTGRALSPAGRRVVTRLSALFLLDAVGGGFLTTSWLSAFFIERFEVSVGSIAALFAGARLLNAGSHLGAAWLAARIGLVRTMVFAHIPSSILLLTVAIAPTFPIAAVLFLLREGLVEMDVPTRHSYLMAVVAEPDRTRASGITSLVRIGGWTLGQAAAGVAGQVALGLSLTIGAGLKLTYDLALFAAFRAHKLPEET